MGAKWRMKPLPVRENVFPLCTSDNYTALSPVRWASNCSVHHMYSVDWQNSDFWLSCQSGLGWRQKTHFKHSYWMVTLLIQAAHIENWNPGHQADIQRTESSQVIIQYQFQTFPLVIPPLRMLSLFPCLSLSTTNMLVPWIQHHLDKEITGFIKYQDIKLFISLLLLFFKTQFI